MERAFSPAGQAARAKMRQQGDFNAARKAYDKAKAANPDPKQLPPGKSGGELATRPSSAISTKAADKGSAIVKQKTGAITPSKPGALAKKSDKGGALVASGRKPDRAPKPYSYAKPQRKPSKPGSSGPDLGKAAKNLGKKAWGAAGDLANAIKKAKTTQKGQPISKGGRIDAPKRGVYNG